MILSLRIKLFLILLYSSLKGVPAELKLYSIPASPPCRLVLMTGSILGLNLSITTVDPMKNEQMTEDFLAINPQHTVPVLDDNGFILSESRAIASYLVEKYAENDWLYPSNARARAKVDDRLQFDMDVLYQQIYDLYLRMMAEGKKYDRQKALSIDRALDAFDGFLTESEWAAGSNVTLADVSFLASVSTAESAGHDVKKFRNVITWYAKMKREIPNYEEANQAGLNMFRERFVTRTRN